MKKYSIFQNARYIYSKGKTVDKTYTIRMIIMILLQLIIPIVATFIPAVVVYLITSNVQISEFIIVMSIVVGGYTLFTFLNTLMSHNLTFDNTILRTKTFWQDLSNKTLVTGYENVESEEGKQKLNLAIGCVSSNWVGIELHLKRFPTFIVSLIGLIMFSVYIFSINVWIIVLLFVMTVINIGLNIYARKYELSKMDILNKNRTKLRYYQEESNKLVNGKDIRIYNLEDWFYRGIKTFTRKYSSNVVKQKLFYFLPNLSDSFFTILRDILAYSILVMMVINGEISIPEFTFMIGIITGFSVWLQQISSSHGELKEANISINNYRNYMAIDDLNSGNKQTDISNLLHESVEVKFDQLSFTYPSASSPTIKNFNLHIKKGERIAIVGINGAGKTTIAKLLSGLYKPTTGDIYIDGISIQDFDRVDYYKLVGSIFQDVNIFAFTIAQAISGQSTDEIDYDLLWKVVEKAGLKEKCDSLPEKVETYLTQEINENGIMLSGGEMQKVMLARVLYKNAPIVILDEPTAALDPIAEQELYLQYKELTKDKISIFISHRLASTQFCDRIVFVEDGEIQEIGTHKELLKNNGKYAYMFDIQSQYYKENIGEEGEHNEQENI